MKLNRVKIRNFRGILEQEFNAHPYTLIVGANNGGKSTVIDCIRAFYEKDGYKFKEASDFPLVATADKESWIEMEFALTDEEHDSLADEYKTATKNLRVRKFFKTTQKNADGKSCAGSIFGYKTDGTLSDAPFYGAKNVQSGKFGDLVYIPALSKVDEHTKLSGPSALRDLLTDVLSGVVQGGAAHSKFSDSVDSFAKAVQTEKTKDDRSLEGFQGTLNDLLEPWKTQFKLRFNAPSAADIIKQMVTWDLVDESHGNTQPIDNYGSGFQRHFIFSLIQMAANYSGKKEPNKTKDFSPSMNLILFEEPEAFLHPPQQETLARSLRKLSDDGKWQVLATTHSSCFVSRNASAIPSIVRAARSAGEVELFQIDEESWERIINANKAFEAVAEKYPKMKKKLHEDDVRPEMEAVKHFLWLNSDRSGLFFANHVLLVEGPTEAALIHRLIDDEKIDVPHGALHVLDCLGKYNIHRFVNLLTEIGIPHSVILDDDKKRNEHADLNDLIKNSRDETLTHSVSLIDGDLESLLDLPKTVPHRKPQHVLFLYSEGKIDDNKLTEFCSMVEGCLPASS